MSPSLADDTVGDKLVRFVIGSVLGGAAIWAVAPGGDDAAYVRYVVLAAAASGAMAALFGNRFLELFISRDRFGSSAWDASDLTTRSPNVSTTADRVMCFIFGAAAGAGLGLFNDGRLPTANVPWSEAVVPALIGGTLCALLGYRFTRFFK